MPLDLEQFNRLIGQDSYVRCRNKKRIDSAIVDMKTAQKHLDSGGQIGWWVRPGYIMVDVDEGRSQVEKVVKVLGVRTLLARTPNGLHMFFKTDKVFPQRVGMVLPCGLRCDFRCANKGYVILPFGQNDRKFNSRVAVEELPFEFTPLIGRKDSLLGLSEGEGRNATLFSHLMAYKNRGASREQLEEMADIIDNFIFDEPMGSKEVQVILNNTDKYEAANQGDNPYLTYGKKGEPTGVNGRAIVDYFVNRGDTLVIGGECYQYREGVYVDASYQIRTAIKDMILLDKFISHTRVMDTYRLLLDDVRLRKTADELNHDKNLINFRNGVWDIQAKTVIPHDSKYLQTIQIPHEVGLLKPIEETRLYAFLQLTDLSDDDIEMLLEYMAYCLTTDYGLKTFLLLYGPSNTGKSTLLRFIETMIGYNNTSALSMHDLNMRFYPAQLYGRLLNSCGDNSSLPLSSIEGIKKITGGDRIMHEKKGKEPFFFTPFCKLVFSFNQLPLQLEEKSNAFYKRMRILTMDKELLLTNDYVNDLCSDESIEEVIPYLLSLLPLPKISQTHKSAKAVESLRRDSDSVHAFLKTCCIEGKDGIVTKDAMYEAYIKFCIDRGREAHKKHNYMRALRAAGLREIRDNNKNYCWQGYYLRKKWRA